MRCKECNTKLTREAKFCPNCGTKVERNKNEKYSKIFAIFSILLMVILAGHFVNKDNASSQTSKLQENATSAKKENTIKNKVVGAAPIPVAIVINQIDNSQFPKIILYASIKDQSGNIIEVSNLKFNLSECISGNGNYQNQIINDVRQASKEPISINLVLDKSGSMMGNKIDKVKVAASSFLRNVNFGIGDKVEITQFDELCVINQNFTNDQAILMNSIDSFNADDGGQTALYDALYTALIETNNQSGPKCVIAFTDGAENCSVNCTAQDVVDLSIKTGIPIFMIGIGGEFDIDELKNIAYKTGGEYFSSDEVQLDKKLADIYNSVYNSQKARYVISYTSKNTNKDLAMREIKLNLDESSGYKGVSQREYVPVTEIIDSISKRKHDKYIIPDSSSRALTDSDLQGLSLVELRIARNEIFARRGRGFKDRLLAKWFFSKDWYNAITPKYTPDEFDRKVNVTRLEEENAEKILALEKKICESYIIQDSSTRKLTEWDVMLSKDTLKKARQELISRSGYGSLSDIEQYNLDLIDKTISLLSD